MRSISDTIARLSAYRMKAETFLPGSRKLKDLPAFGSNPGALKGQYYLPANCRGDAPLVVVLHGCLQTAEGYNHGAGWSQLADENGFALLFPEQQRSNNPNLCFNWFQSQDTQTDGGEALSIRQMIEKMVLDHSLNRNRIFITGLSAGGAMAAAMLASYPDVFAGGGIIAGLPYGSATTVQQAFDRMRGHGEVSAEALGLLVQNATSHGGPWPRLSIWHGDADTTVSPSNGVAIGQQWRHVHNLGAAPALTEVIDGHTHRVWNDPQGRPAIEEYVIAGLGHGTPLLTGAGGYGEAGPYMLDAGISSTRRIAEFWEIAPKVPGDTTSVAPLVDRMAGIAVPSYSQDREPAGRIPMPRRARPLPPRPEASFEAGATRIRNVIEDALRSAGLMK
jgi:poly(hydroxyalkanoate) depolymerase family esterase